ncbi:hypothetical protein [Aquimarina sediminis]|uniref:hypothetical protein n=1 Tax=Aquimarina sediminis TaxID=2070536 RepID=UPI000CA00A3D|nr:hypothetical protein [Aquimarina sediminis]
MVIKFIKFGFLHNYISREELLSWSDIKLMNNSVEDIFVDLSSLTSSDSNSKIVEILNKHKSKDYDTFRILHLKFLNLLHKYIRGKNWEEIQFKMLEYYDFFYDDEISLFSEEYEFWNKLHDDFHLREEGFNGGCMLMPTELFEYFQNKNIEPTEKSFLELLADT